jgi:hypothetical protein
MLQASGEGSLPIFAPLAHGSYWVARAQPTKRGLASFAANSTTQTMVDAMARAEKKFEGWTARVPVLRSAANRPRLLVALAESMVCPPAAAWISQVACRPFEMQLELPVAGGVRAGRWT